MMPPLALYIHFPWCVQKCPYCDFNSHALRGTMPENQYIQALIADWQQDLEWIEGRAISSIFCGGGTPSLFSGDSIHHLLSTIRKSIPFTEDIEITLEANPGTLSRDSLSALHAAGVNRLSIGAQSFQADKLRALGRIHGPEAIYQAMQLAKEAGFTRINLDLMYGLPQQTVADALYDLQQACALAPSHLSWYQLTLEPNTPFYRTPPPLPAEDEVMAIGEEGEAYLKTQAYQRYEISAFCRNADYCRHNVNYWQYGDYIGIGAGAHGKITLENGTILRTAKKKHPKHYLEGQDFKQEELVVSQKDSLFEFMLNALRLQDKISWALLEERSGWQRQNVFVYCDELVNKGLMEYNEESFYLTEKGKFFTNEAISVFLPE
ncbi:MAG: radical SAM family heme chaperone HemW [Gammaproteobacteria bacterium]|nr:radical SAM family heme chaperone HemW [Gammaproteobacteria bacterium]